MGFLRKDIQQVDANTGEILPSVAVLIPEKAKFKDTFVMMHQDGFLRLAGESDLTGDDHRVLNMYLYNLDFENYIQINQQEFADYLKMRRQHVSRSTKKLTEKGILVKGPKVGKHNTYRLNAFFGWKGKVNKNYHEAYEEHSKLIQ